jgi:hypothetical protein
VSSGSGGSRSSTRRESPVPCLDADQRVQAHALLQVCSRSRSPPSSSS